MVALSALLFLYGNGIFPLLSPSAARAETAALSGESRLEEGRELLKKGQYQEALDLLLKSAESEPGNPVVLNYLGEAYFRLKMHQKAIDALNRSIDLDPEYLLPHIGLGIIYDTLGETQKAKKEFEEALRIGGADPDDSSVKFAAERLKRIEVREHLSKGRILYGEGKPEDALAEYRMAIEKDPDNLSANMSAGYIAKELKRLKEAFEAVNKVLEIQPENVAAHLMLGELHATAGAFDEAIPSFREVLRLAPGSAEAKLAEFFIQSSEKGLLTRKLFEEAAEATKGEQYDKAVEIYKKILEEEPANSFAFYNLGVAYYKKDRFEEAVEVLKKSIEIDPHDLTARYQLATVYDKMGRYEEAAVEYGKIAESESTLEVVDNAKDRLGILKRYAEVKEGVRRIELLIEGGDVEEALREVERLLAQDDRDAEAHLLLGRIHMKKGDIEKAFESINKALRIKSDLWDAFVLLGQIYEMQGKYSDAEDAYRAVTSKAPRTRQGLIAADLLKGIAIPIRFEQAKRYLNKGDIEGSLKEINAILEVLPDDPVALYNAGILYYRLDMLREAVFYLKKAVEIKPEYVQAHLQLGLVYQAALAFDLADKAFRKVLDITGEGTEANIAKFRLGIIKEEEALVNLLKEASRLMRTGNYSKAQEELEAIIRFTPNNHIAHFQLGVMLERMDRREEALDSLKRTVEIKPDYAIAHLFMARLYEEDGFYREARDAYKRVIDVGAGGREAAAAEVALKRFKNWRISGNMGHTIDSNISYGATKRTTGISTGHGLSFSYGLYTREKMRLSLDLSVNRSLTYSSQLSGMNYEGGFNWYHKIRENQFYRLNAGYTYGTFMRERSYETFSYSANTSIDPDNFLTSLSFAYNFNLTRSFINPTSDADRHSLSCSLSKNLSLRDRVSGTYSFSVYMNKDPMGSNYANRNNGISLSYSRILMPGVSAGANYGLNFINYSNPDSTTLFTQFRRNTSETMGVNISYKLSDNVTFFISVSSVNAKTNLPPPSAEERLRLQDILAAPIPTIGGGYDKETVSMSLSVTY